LADFSSPFYNLILKPRSNPAHGSGRIFQVLTIYLAR
jgi:hypothetical protein